MKEFRDYFELYNAIKTGVTVSQPHLLFFVNAVANSLGCDCVGLKEAAITRYQNLKTDLNYAEKYWLSQIFNVTTLQLNGDGFSSTIPLK